MTESGIADILAAHFGWTKNTVLANYSTGLAGWESDLLVVRPSRWAIEIEIKVTKSDFRADFKKGRRHEYLERGFPKYHINYSWYTDPAEWNRLAALPTSQIIEHHGGLPWRMVDWSAPEKHFAQRFYFAMPSELADQVLPEIPHYAGLIAIDKGMVKITKEAPKNPMAQKVTDEKLHHILHCAYYRYHQHRIGELNRKRLSLRNGTQ